MRFPMQGPLCVREPTLFEGVLGVCRWLEGMLTPPLPPLAFLQPIIDEKRVPNLESCRNFFSNVVRIGVLQ